MDKVETGSTETSELGSPDRLLWGVFQVLDEGAFTAEGAERAGKTENEGFPYPFCFSLCVLRVLCGETVLAKVLNAPTVAYCVAHGPFRLYNKGGTLWHNQGVTAGCRQPL
jgi:hypothetical protein